MSEILYYALEPAKFRLDGGAMYGIIPKPLWQKGSPPDEENRIDLALRCLLIRTESKNILIDTGIGDYHPEKFNKMFDIRTEKNPLALCLQELGLKPEDITDLIISHLHFDHAGGIGQLNSQGEMTPIFTNAKLHLHKDHYNYSQNPGKRDAGSFHTQSFNPIIEYYGHRNQIHWLQGTQGEILTYDNSEVLNFLSSNGHTPHLIHPFDDKFIYLADIIPTSNHLRIPWVMGYDLMPGVSADDKERILKIIAEHQLTIVFEHDVEYWGCTVEKNAKDQVIAKEKFPATDARYQQIFN